MYGGLVNNYLRGRWTLSRSVLSSNSGENFEEFGAEIAKQLKGEGVGKGLCRGTDVRGGVEAE